MLAKRILPAVIAALVVAGAAAPAEARVCQRNPVIAAGNWAQTQVGARFSARLAWRQRASALYGARYASWTLAAEKSYRCIAAGSRDRCRAVARPCRFSSWRGA